MDPLLLLLVVLVVVGVLAYPRWPYSQTWGYAPFGGVGAILLIIVLLLLFGHGHVRL